MPDAGAQIMDGACESPGGPDERAGTQPAGMVTRTTRNEDSETLINNRQNGRRRGRGGTQVRGPGNGPDRGNRIDNRARGNAAQLHEKYRNLARDAQTQGDRVMTEYYLQFADHYFRVLNESRARFEEQNQQRRPRFENDEYEEAEETAEGSEDVEREQHSPEPRRDEREFRRQDREPRRREREREPVAAEAEAPREDAGEEEPAEGRRRGRGRPRRRAEGETQSDEAPHRIEVDRLPPAFAAPDTAADPTPVAEVTGTDEPAEAAPRRRRARRTATPSEDSIAAA